MVGVSLQGLRADSSSLHVDYQHLSYATEYVHLSTLRSASAGMCVRVHDNAPILVASGSVALSPSLCALLGVGGGEKVSVIPVTPIRSTLRVRSPNHRAGPHEVTVSSSVMQLLNSGDRRLFLVPSSYAQIPHNIEVTISSVEPTLSDSEAVIEAHRSVYESLVSEAEQTVLAYCVTAGEEASLRVLCHPGWVYLTAEDARRLNVNSGSFIELQNSRRRAVVQVYSSTSQEQSGVISSIDSNVGAMLGIARNTTVLALPLSAQLFWARKHSLDDSRSKARAVVTVTKQTAEHNGYLNGELIDLFVGTQRSRAYIESVAADLKDDELALTSLLMRELGCVEGSGILVRADPSGRILARVGILNVDEVGKLSVKGSSHLSAQFAMPCLVQLRNLLTTSSLDIIMEPDPYTRPAPTVRMARSTRDILSLDRGGEVLVSAIRLSPLSVMERCKTALLMLQYKALGFLIGSRPIHMSVEPGQLWDDEGQVARTSHETLALLGVTEGERVRISYRRYSISRVILARKAAQESKSAISSDMPQVGSTISPELQLNLDAQGRYALGRGHVEFGTVVTVERDMRFFFKRSLNLSILSTVGAVVTVIALFRSKPVWLQVVAGICVVAIYFYLALSVERSKVQ